MKESALSVRRLTLPLSRRNIRDLEELQGLIYRKPQKLSQADLERAIRARNVYIFVAVTPEGKIVAKGTICLSRDELGVSARLENIICSKAYRRQGLMTGIVSILLRLAKKRRPYIIHLLSHPFRRGAYAFYKKIGFLDSCVHGLVFPL